MTVTVPLVPDQFGARRRLLAGEGFTVETFRYRSGVEGLAITGEAAQLEVLPFTGQQIWRARFLGRDLTMRSTFDEPVPTSRYLENNGAYFIHCGGSAMGNPGEGDEHPLHGELPNARLDDVVLEIDSGVLVLRGSMTHRISFGPYLRAELSLRLGAGEPVVESEARLTNLSGERRPLMYLAHINARPAVGGRIEEELEPGRIPVTRAAFELGTGDGVRAVGPGELDAGALALEDLLAAGVRVEPELVQSVPSAAAGGWVTVRQRHPSGDVDVVSFRRGDLTHTLRWLRRSADDDAFGFALPATAEADGFAAETAKGNVRLYEPGESLIATIRHGAQRPGDPAGHLSERTHP